MEEPLPQPPRLTAVLMELSETLRGLHRELLRAEGHALEAARGERLPPTELLKIALQEGSALAWLRPLSELIVDLDLFIEEPAHEPFEVAAVHAEVERLLAGNEGPGSVGARCHALVQASPDIAVGFAGVKRALGVVHQTELATPDAAARLHEAHRWIERQRHQRQGRAALRRTSPPGPGTPGRGA